MLVLDCGSLLPQSKVVHWWLWPLECGEKIFAALGLGWFAGCTHKAVKRASPLYKVAQGSGGFIYAFRWGGGCLNHLMTDAIAIHGHDIIDLIANFPDGIPEGRLSELVVERFGKSATFHTCSAAGMDLDGLLHFLEARDKVRIASGVVYPGGSPACQH